MASYSHPFSPNRRSYDRYAPPYERYRDDHIPYPSQYPDDHRSYPPPPVPRYYDDYDDRSHSWAPPSPPTASYDHPRASSSRNRDHSGIMATPMLEPSESWKDSHYEPPRRREASPSDWHRPNNSTYYSQEPPDRDYRPRNASYDSYRPPPDQYEPYEPEEYRPQYDSRVSPADAHRISSLPTAPRADRKPQNTIMKPRSPIVSRPIAQTHSPRLLPAQSNSHQLSSTPVATPMQRPQPIRVPVSVRSTVSPPPPKTLQSSTAAVHRPTEHKLNAAAPTPPPPAPIAPSRPSDVPREPRAYRKPDPVPKPVSRSSSRSSIASSIASSRASSPLYSTRSESVTNQGSMTTVTEVMSTPGADAKPESGIFSTKPTSRAQSVHRSSRHSSVGLDLPGFDLPSFGEIRALSPPAKPQAADRELQPRLDDLTIRGGESPPESPVVQAVQIPDAPTITTPRLRSPSPPRSAPSAFVETAKSSPAPEPLPNSLSTTPTRGLTPKLGGAVAITPPETLPSIEQIILEVEPLPAIPNEPITHPPRDPTPTSDAQSSASEDEQESETPVLAPVYRPPLVLMEMEYERAQIVPRNLTEAKTLPDVLRYVVERRMPEDLLLRENRVEPIISSNLRLATQKEEPDSINTTAALFSSLTEKLYKANNQIAATKLALQHRLAERTEAHLQKLENMDKEYVDLRMQWLSKNAALDNQARVLAAEQAELQPVATSGRTTRRSTAMMGDLVRSDLEYEQILASLGNDDLTDPARLCKANLAIIPDMATVEFSSPYVFDDSNHLVSDPAAYYGPITGTNDWTDEEKSIYQEQFALYPKQFGVIAEALSGKTSKQCVDFYYLHKKVLIDFRKIVTQFGNRKGRGRGRRMASKKGSALMKDIRQHDAEVKSDASTAASRRRVPAALAPAEPKKSTASRRMITIQAEDSSTAASTPEPEGTKRKRRRVEPAAREDDEPESSTKAVKRAPRRTANTRKPKTSVPTTPVPVAVESTDEAVTSLAPTVPPPPRMKPKTTMVHWSDEDKSSFLALLSQHGDDFKRIAASMPNKTTIQVTNFYKANAEELGLAKVIAESSQNRLP